MRAYALILTLILITLFSTLSIEILHKNSLNFSTTKKFLYYKQAKLHEEFFVKFIKSLDLSSEDKKIEFVDREFNIYAKLNPKDENSSYVDLYIESKDSEVKTHKRFITSLTPSN